MTKFEPSFTVPMMDPLPVTTRPVTNYGIYLGSFMVTKTRRIAMSACEQCGTSQTPLWRKDDRDRNLCNACGIRWKRGRTKKIHPAAAKLAKAKPTKSKAKFDRLITVAEEMYREMNREMYPLDIVDAVMDTLTNSTVVISN